MQEINKFGLLMNDAAKLHRKYFDEICKLQGIQVLYRAPYPGKDYTIYAEIDSNYEKPICVGCLFHEHPNQYTMRKIGWVAELQENASLIDVPYDLPNLQVGALFIVPSGLDDGKGRIFRVTQMFTSMVYPSAVTCQIVPEYVDTFEPHRVKDIAFEQVDMTLIQEEESIPSVFIH